MTAIALMALLPLCELKADVVTVDNPSGSGTYQALVDQGLNYRTVDSLKVIGTVSDSDFKFLGNSMNSLKWIDLSETDITAIPEEAFYRCQSLTEIILPSTVETFMSRCFDECYNLESVSGYENVRTIGYRAFAHTKITKVPFGDEIISIGDQAFYYCEKITGDIVFPDCFKTLDNYAFHRTSISSVDFSNCSVNRIPWYCFADCYNLGKVTFSENTAFSIDGYAFWQDTLLKYIFIPEKVTSIGDRSFGFDWSMTNRTVTMQSKTPISAENNSFADSYKEYLTLNVPAGTTFDYITSRGYSVFDAVKEVGYSVSVEGKGTVSVGDHNYANGSIYFADNINDTKFNIIPATGYDIVSISFNDNPVTLTDGSYTVDASVMTGSLKVKFAAKSLNLTVAKGSGGTISYNGASVENGTIMAVNGGESINFSIVPDDGCFIKTITFNGTEYMTLNGAMNFNTPVLADNSTLTVDFGTEQDVADYLMVKISQKGYGTILYKDTPIKQGSTVLVKRGEKPEFTFVPGNDGYVKSLLVNSLDLSSSLNANQLSFGSLNQDIDMQVEFFSAVDVQIDNPNGKLKSLLTEQEIVPRKIKNLKLTGNVSDNDMTIISSMQLLQTVDLSETTITSIPSELFKSKTSLESVAFPLTLTSIGWEAFYECRNLKYVTGCDNVRRIENGAFRYCESLEVLPFGNKIEELNGPFSYCKSLPEKIVMPSSLKWIINSSFNGSSVIYLDLSQCSSEGYFDWYAFAGLKTVLLPENGKYRLDDEPFNDSKITSLIIPESVTECYRRIFNGANNLRDVYLRSSEPPTTDSDPFGGNYTTMTLHVPAGSAEDYLNTPFWGDFGKIVEYGIGLQSDSRGVVYVNDKRQANESAIFTDGNNDLILSMVPNSGFELDQVLFNGTPLEAQANGTYTIAAGIDEGTLAVKWKAKKYDITVNYSGNGFILCGGQTIANGGVVTVDTASVVQFEMAPTSGYLVKNISFNGTESVVQNGGKVYVTPAISGASRLDVAFAEASGTDGVYTFSISTGNNGTIVYKHTTLLQETSINIAAGDKAVFEINPKNNYEIAQVTYNDADVTQNVVNGQYVVNSVSEAASLKVSFSVKTDVVVPLTVAGTLGTVMFDELKENVEKLAVTGPMNSSDFTVIREEMPHLQYLNLSGADFSYINGYSFNSDSTQRSFTKIVLPPTMDYIYSKSFSGCTIDTFVVTSNNAFSGSWDAFDDYAKYNTILCVPVGTEDSYAQYNPWNYFKHMTDGVINRNDEVFTVGNIQFMVTDIDNNKVKAVINSVSEFAGVSETVSVGSQTFTVDGARFANTNSDGHRYILTNSDFGPWKGKYLYSPEYRGGRWVGAPDDNWTTADFDDSNWTEFDGPLSTGGDYTQWKGQNDCYWVRRTFQLDEIDFRSLRLYFSIWEPMEIYVNGVKIREDSWCNEDIPASYFRVGKNVLAARLEHKDGYERMDFSLRQKDFMIDGLIYSITNITRKEMALVGADASMKEIAVPSTVSFLGKEYTITSVAESAFRSNDVTRKFSSVKLSSIVTSLGCEAFYDCLIDTLILDNTTAFDGCWYAFDNNCKQHTVVCVPVGMEDEYRKYSPWNEFKYITDGVANRNDDIFYVDNIKYVVTDIDNKQVQAYINSVAEYDLLPSEVQVDGTTFAIASVNLSIMDSNGNIMIVPNGDNGPWKGKYWYSSEKTGDTWIGGTWTGGPASNWMNMDFDDTRWTDFNGPIKTSGYGGYTDWKGDYDCYWVRRIVELSKEDLNLSVVRLNISMDDEILLYINGTEVYSGGSTTITIPTSLFKVGKNIIAAQGVNSGGGPGYMDFSIYKSGFEVDGFNYSITNSSSNKEVALIGINPSKKDINIPSTVSFIGTTYKVTSISSSAFNYDNSSHYYGRIELPSTITYLECDAFSGCMIDTLVVNNTTAYSGCWSAFDDNVKNNTVLLVPEGMENEYVQYNPWNYFKNVTDGIVNRNNESFIAGNIKYVVTDIENKEVEALINTADEYKLLPATVSVDGQSFTVSSANLSIMDSNGFINIVSNGDNGPWVGKYLYSSENNNGVWTDAPAAEWMNPNFDDSNWKVFNGPLGGNTNWKGEYDCYWVRRTFELDNTDLGCVYVNVEIDDEIVLYINGTKIYTGGYGRVNVPVSCLKKGTNVIAAQCINYGGAGYVDFGLKQTAINVDGLAYEITNKMRHEVALVGAKPSVTEMNIPSVISFLGSKYTVTSIAESAFRSDDGGCSISKLTLPSTVTYLGCETFRGCMIDTVVLNSTTAYNSCWSAFDNNAKSQTVLYVPVGTEDVYKQYSPWNEFRLLTDGVINRNNETFESGNMKFIVTDIDNNKVQAVVSSISQYSLVPQTVTVNDVAFTVDGATFDNVDSNGNRYLLTNRDFGSWKAKYMYSAEYKDSTWVGAPDDSWTKPDYDDSNWGIIYGPVTYGYGGNYTEWKGNNDCYWIRRTFQLEKIDFKSLRIGFDTWWGVPMTVYINGVLFKKSNYCYEDVPASYFKVGTNVVAMSMERNGDYILMDLSLQQTEYAIDGLLYSITNNTKKEVALKGALTGAKEITVPPTVTMLGTTYKVTSIASLGSNKEITKVLGMKNVERFEYNSFANCTSLNEVAIPDGLKYIGGYSFYNCPKLNQDIVIPASASIEEWAFHYSGIKSVTISSSSIGNYAFADCNSLEKVVLTDDVQRIGYEAFRSCNNIRSVIMGSGLTSIGERAFCYSAIDSIVIPSSVVTIGNSAFSECRNLVYVQLPENLTTIESYAFNECRGIAALTIPASVTSIGVNALYGIGFVRMESSTPPVLSSEDQFEEIAAILLPNGAYDAYCNAAYWSNYQKQFTTADNMDRVAVVTQNPTGSNLEQVLGEENLPYIVGLKVIGTINSYDIFMIRNKMTLLRKLDLSEATIVANDYEYYEGHHSEDNVIGPYSFSENNLSSVILPANAIKIGSNAFENCRYLTQIVIPDAVEYIEWNAFSNCNLLRYVYIGDGVKTIEGSAFWNCDNLRELHMGRNVTAIGSWAFYSCDNLRLIEFSPKLKMISEYAFASCWNLTDLILPSSLIQISNGAFESCSSLREVKIPSSVKYIYDYAFNGCPLEKVYTYTIEPTKISQHTFSASAYKTSRLYIPSTSKYNYYYDTQWGQFTGGFVDFDEPYDFFYLNGDYELTSTTGRINGTPDMEMNSGSGIIVEGNDVQNLSNIELNFEFRTGWDYENQTSYENKGASIIAGDGETSINTANLTAESMDVNIGVDGQRWYFFCFPFDLALDSIECTSDYVFYTYDGAKRAKGQSGWVKLDSEVTTLSEDNGYIFQSSRTGILTIHVDSKYLSFKSEDKQKILHTYEASSASNASWNFLGNPFISYYDIADLASEYDAPIAVWNGNSYDVYKPGDDDNYQLKPFEAFFVQKDGSKSAVEFLPENRITYSAAIERNIERANQRAKVGNTIDLNRRIVNIEIAGGTDGKTDKTRLVFNNDATMDYEIGRDASKFHTDGVPQIYTVNGSVKYAINERPTGMDDIHLGFYAPVEGEYTLSVPRSDAEVEIYDNLTKKTVDFTFGDYTFNSEAGTFNERFVVRLTGGGITAVKDGFRVDGITVVTVDGGIELSGNVSGRVTIYNEAGMLLSKPDFAGKLTLDDGIYLIKIGDNSVKLSVK